MSKLTEKKKEPEKKNIISDIPNDLIRNINDYSVTEYEAKIIIEPRWNYPDLKREYGDTVESTNDGAYFKHMTYFTIKLPRHYIYVKPRNLPRLKDYANKTYLLSLPYKMLQASAGKSIRKEISEMPISDVSDEDENRLDISFSIDFFPVLNLNLCECNFMFTYKIKIPPYNVDEQGVSTIDKFIAAKKKWDKKEKEWHEEAPELYTPEGFDAQRWWKEQDLYVLINEIQWENLIITLKEHLIKLAPKVCKMLLPSSKTKAGTSAYKLRPGNDDVLSEKWWGLLINDILNTRSRLSKLIKLQNNQTLIEKTDPGIKIVNFKQVLKF